MIMRLVSDNKVCNGKAELIVGGGWRLEDFVLITQRRRATNSQHIFLLFSLSLERENPESFTILAALP